MIERCGTGSFSPSTASTRIMPPVKPAAHSSMARFVALRMLISSMTDGSIHDVRAYSAFSSSRG